jgi:hypothetical protein
MDFITVSLSLQITHEVFFAQSDTFLAISSQSHSTANSLSSNSSTPKLIFWQAGVSKLNSINLFPFYNPSTQTTHKTQPLSIVEVCLQGCCIATEVIRLLLAYSLPQECVYRTVA